MKRAYRVVIVQEHVPHYRVRFYDELRKMLADQGIELDLYYSPQNSIAAIPGKVAWAQAVPCYKFWKIAWQPVFKKACRADLVILPQESKYLLNYLILIYAVFSKLRVALWGHGKDFQAQRKNGQSEKIKRWLSLRADWWFAYTERSREVLDNMGFDSGRITTVQNSIDIERIQRCKEQVTDEDLDRLKNELGINSEHVAIFTGRFFPIKRTAFFLQACELIREKIPDFHIILIGKGPEQYLVDEACTRHSWIHAVGVKNDEEKVPYWMVSKLLLMPGALGLVVLDSFVFGVPMVTTSVGGHGPEIAYLDNGRNGVVTEDDPDDVRAYADKVVDLMSSKSQLTEMSRQCLQDAELYSIEEMVDRFVDGVESVVKI